MNPIKLILPLVSLVTLAQSQNISIESSVKEVEEFMSTINQEDLKQHLYTLASDDYEGRETTERGQKMAADYIAKHFYHLGLTGPVPNQPNPYFQPIEFKARKIKSATIRSINTSLQAPQDFFGMGYFSAELPETPLIFAGYGLQTDQFTDVTAEEIKGKGLVLIDGVPRDNDGNPLVEKAPSLWQRIRRLSEQGAAFVIVTYPSIEEFDSKSQLWRGFVSKPNLMLASEESRSGSMPIFMMNPDKVALLMGVESKNFFKTLEKKAKKGTSPANSFATVPVKISAELEERKAFSENVLGFMEGGDLKDEILVITSHYDHVGIINGEIHNGADDDGSGTVGVLEIAEAFSKAKAAGFTPRRSILFMTVTGEEKGLFGSAYYADHPVFPMESTITNLNIDMIGRIDPEREAKDPYVYIIGSNMLSTDLHQIHEKVSSTFAKGLTMDYKYNSKDDPQRFYYRSDHYNFAKNNIPVIFYFNGTHEDYHQPTDTPDKIQYELLESRAKLVFATAWELANRNEKPVVDKAPE
ncbi:MAG: hypothetical protein RLZZ248_2083 [Bacteroidota bacterium]|jgi:hypothetical protein